MRSLIAFFMALLLCPQSIWAQEDIPDINAFIIVEQEPNPINMHELRRIIHYPIIAQRKGIEGNVVARVLVSPEGDYVKHVLMTEPDSILIAAVEPHISKLKFTSALQDGKPIYFWVNVPFNFVLVDAEKPDGPSQWKMPEDPIERKKNFIALGRVVLVAVLLLGLGLLLKDYST